ncbi:flagellin [Suilimivivens aceti]|uniref:Flagellin n=1 Tax=Suilimivivens aceti TaxID=2981774 RepID=A0ABT2T2G4_9FIRM|nr:flagellin [Suilimivivens aceti]MCU6744433.1 flagellin [Suilimivivens aceti]SCH75088.1 Flagellin B [uncultured Clostridium sp.]
MVVQHNLTAMNSNRMLGLTTKTQAKSTEKLSSGYKINRAADDAAGLSISEKMRKQIRGLTQASLNAQDGISAVQTAEGALNEVQDMLQRMNELAVKSANGTNSEDDRSYIQNEIDQLTTEIDRVAETTKFNETYLLKGDKTADKKNIYSYGSFTNKAATFTAGADGASGAKLKITLTDPTTADTATLQNEVMNALANKGASISIEKGQTTGKVAGLEGFEVDTNGNVKKDGKETGVKLEVDGTITADTGKDRTETLTIASVDSAAKSGPAQYYDKDGNKIAANALSNYVTGDNGKVTQIAGKKLYDAAGNEATLDAAAIKSDDDALVGALTLTLHVGADATSNNQISVTLDAMSAKGLGVNGLKVDGTDDKNALSAVDTIKEAIQKVSTQRSALGAAQNRLEHTISNLDNVVENTTSAESQIRDTDMATEMVKYSNNNILSQAGQAMLAQANQSNQGVLSLLQ